MSVFSTYNFKGQKALIRVDFNVPLNDKLEITDDSRMKAAIPTIKKILGDGGMVILMSHFGRPKGGPEEKYSLKHLIKHLHALLNEPAVDNKQQAILVRQSDSGGGGNKQQATANDQKKVVPVHFANDCIGEQAFLTANMMRPGEVISL